VDTPPRIALMSSLVSDCATSASNQATFSLNAPTSGVWLSPWHLDTPLGRRLHHSGVCCSWTFVDRNNGIPHRV
jgi:hypothetical protein